MLIVGSGILTLWREKARGTPLPPSVAAEGQAGLVEEAQEPSVASVPHVAGAVSAE